MKGIGRFLILACMAALAWAPATQAATVCDQAGVYPYEAQINTVQEMNDIFNYLTNFNKPFAEKTIYTLDLPLPDPILGSGCYKFTVDVDMTTGMLFQDAPVAVDTEVGSAEVSVLYPVAGIGLDFVLGGIQQCSDAACTQDCVALTSEECTENELCALMRAVLFGDGSPVLSTNLIGVLNMLDPYLATAKDPNDPTQAASVSQTADTCVVKGASLKASSCTAEIPMVPDSTESTLAKDGELKLLNPDPCEDYAEQNQTYCTWANLLLLLMAPDMVLGAIDTAIEKSLIEKKTGKGILINAFGYDLTHDGCAPVTYRPEIKAFCSGEGAGRPAGASTMGTTGNVLARSPNVLLYGLPLVAMGLALVRRRKK